MNTQPNDGGPAFPITQLILAADGSVERVVINPGMSLRDYFAGQALASMDYGWFESYKRESEMASQSYAIADAMLSARERKEGV